MIHFKGMTTRLMDMSKAEKTQFLQEVDLETTEFYIKITDFGMSI